MAAAEELAEAAFGRGWCGGVWGVGGVACGMGIRRVVERAARTLKKIAERDAAALYAWRKALLKEALRGGGCAGAVESFDGVGEVAAEGCG